MGLILIYRDWRVMIWGNVREGVVVVLNPVNAPAGVDILTSLRIVPL
jgi:hypothetical protein